MQKNHIELAGYLANKPEARYLPSGMKVANARLKESYRFTGRDGQQQTHANWHSIVFYGDVADIALTFEKDDNIFVEGSLQQRKFTPADGVARTVYEVHARSCHQIAERAQLSVPRNDSNEPTSQGANYDDPSWPVGLLKSATAAAITIALTGLGFKEGGVRVNASSSLPIGLYIKTSARRANLVEFCPPEPFASVSKGRGYRPGGSSPDAAEPLMKPVVAAEGDVVEVSASGVAVNGRLLPNSSPRPVDTENRLLRHWPFGQYQVAADTVWVVSSFNQRSFDSRYFGPIPNICIRSRLLPLLTE